VRRSVHALSLFLVVGLSAQAPAPSGRPGSPPTALDLYVAAPDSHFSFHKVGDLPGVDGVTVTVLELTSQQWPTGEQTDRPVWTHWLVVYRPTHVARDVGLLFIGGGDNDGTRPSKVNAPLAEMARDTSSVTAELRMVPNQPLTFRDDPARKARSEDEIVAYTWDRYLRTGDERWPLRLPMTKAAVRAMDAMTAWTASAQGGGRPVRRFVVAGASKRGWTTWTTAAVDRRVVAIIPAVIDLLRVVPSFTRHWQAYGFWAPAVQDYVDQGIMRWLGTPQFARLMALVDPWSYRDRYTMPKFILNSSGDQFFLPDSAEFYFDGLPGEKHLRYVPNSDHSLDGTDAFESLEAFYALIVTGTPRPHVAWSRDAHGHLQVTSSDRPGRVRLWTATNPDARDFRLETFGPHWTSVALDRSGPNRWSARIQPPPRGWTAAFVELTFPSGGRYPLVVTTDVNVTPDRLPFPPPSGVAPSDP
jgi:PhoPQ-activated pathogenicity-related protein